MIAEPSYAKIHYSPSNYNLATYCEMCETLENPDYHQSPWVGGESISNKSSATSNGLCQHWDTAGKAESQEAESAQEWPFEQPLPQPERHFARNFIAEHASSFPDVGIPQRQYLDAAALLGANPLMSTETAVDIMKSARRSPVDSVELERFFQCLRIHRKPVNSGSRVDVTLPLSDRHIDVKNLQSHAAQALIASAYIQSKTYSPTLLDGALSIVLKHLNRRLQTEVFNVHRNASNHEV